MRRGVCYAIAVQDWLSVSSSLNLLGCRSSTGREGRLERPWETKLGSVGGSQSSGLCSDNIMMNLGIVQTYKDKWGMLEMSLRTLLLRLETPKKLKHLLIPLRHPLTLSECA